LSSFDKLVTSGDLSRVYRCVAKVFLFCPNCCWRIPWIARGRSEYFLLLRRRK